MNSKIKTLPALLKLVRQLKKANKKIVTYNGSFDLLHIGHIRSITQAKKYGDVLIILLNSDSSVQKYKGSKRPLIGQENRAETLAALVQVDYVSVFDDLTPISVLDKIKPDIHCNGGDWGKNCVERAVVEKNGGQIKILNWQSGFSTTSLIEKIKELYSTPTAKAVFLDRDGTINHNKDGYIHKIEDFEFLPGAIEALHLLQNSDYKIIVVTNQSGIGRGYYSQTDFQKLNDWFIADLDSRGIKIEKVYYCPHRPDEGCDCRKPGIKLFLEAVADFDISLNDSWLVGDDTKDIIAARNINLKSIKIGSKEVSEIKLEPNYYSQNLHEAVTIILREA